MVEANTKANKEFHIPPITSFNGITKKANEIKMFNVFHQNIRGLRGKANELLSHLHPVFPHILCFTEHHMNPLELQQLNIDSYKLAANYCRTLYEKGGVCIYLHTSLNFVNIKLTKDCIDKDFEVCAVKLNLRSKRFCIITVYRAPTGNIDTFITKLDTILRNLYSSTQEYIICGDININYLSDSERKSRLDAVLRTYNLINIVNFPTRIQGNSATAIDNIFVDITSRDNYSIRPIINGLSDHDAQSITFNTINMRSYAKQFKIIRKINKHTIDDFLIKLSYETWDLIFSSDDVNTMFNSFLDTYLKIYYASFPQKKIKISNKKSDWITLGIKTSCKRKRELYIACRNSNNLELRNYYKKYCNILSGVIKEAKRLKYDSKIKKSNNKNKTIWDIVKFETNRGSHNDRICTLKVNGKRIRENHVIAETFNKYFLSVAEKSNVKNKQTNINTSHFPNTTPIQYLLQAFMNPFPNIKLNSLSTKEVENIIKSLKLKNSYGYDEISTKVLKMSSVYISSPLTHICNKSLSQGIFPDRLKYSQIKPLFKKGDKSNISNYRPISLLTSFSKVLEKAMSIQLLEHLNKNNILVDEQFGFRTNTSTDSAIYKLTNEIHKALNSKNLIGGIFCDLEKAFDCVNHEVLLSKLEFYGIKGKAKLWFESYFSNRYQRVVITDTKLNLNDSSTWGKMRHGVPQGSILGPLLFLLYVNDLPKIINEKTVPILFADDTSVLVTSLNYNDLHVKINSALHSINEWFKVNQLSINFNKTHYIHFSASNNKPITETKIAYEGKEITTVSNIKFLGIHIDEKMNWKCHIEHITSKTSAVCYIIRSIKPFTSLSTLKMVYHSYFNSIINYGIPFWGNSPLSIKIFRMQKNIIRIMLGCRRRDSCRKLFKKLEILPLASQYILSLMLFVAKNRSEFTVNSEIHRKNTRQQKNLHLPLVNLRMYQKGIYYSGTKVYNNLPQHIKDVSSDIKMFEVLLKQFLLLHSFYSLQEYFCYKSP